MGLAGMTRDATPSIVRINPPELGTPPGYSQIVDVSAGRIIFMSGQIALDRDGNVVGKSDFAAQAAQVFCNLAIALRASGCTAANLVKLTVFLTDMDNRALSRGAQPVLCLGHAAGRARGDAGRGVETVWCGFHDLDRGHRGGVMFVNILLSRPLPA
jgi:enamine deaminase RidA (YjgF/YER057c/UK114 family)